MACEKRAGLLVMRKFGEFGADKRTVLNVFPLKEPGYRVFFYTSSLNLRSC